MPKGDQDQPCWSGCVVVEECLQANVLHESLRRLGCPPDGLVRGKGPEPLHVGSCFARVDILVSCKLVDVPQGGLHQAANQPIGRGFLWMDLVGGEGKEEGSVKGSEIVVKPILSEDGMHVVHIIGRVVRQRCVPKSTEGCKVGVRRILRSRGGDIPILREGRGDWEVSDPSAIVRMVKRLEGLSAGEKVRLPTLPVYRGVACLEMFPCGPRGITWPSVGGDRCCKMTYPADMALDSRKVGDGGDRPGVMEVR